MINCVKSFFQVNKYTTLEQALVHVFRYGSNWLLHMAVLSCTVIPGRVDFVAWNHGYALDEY